MQLMETKALQTSKDSESHLCIVHPRGNLPQHTARCTGMLFELLLAPQITLAQTNWLQSIRESDIEAESSVNTLTINGRSGKQIRC